MKTKSFLRLLLFCYALSWSIQARTQTHISNFFEGKPSKTIEFVELQGLIIVNVVFNDILPLNFIFDTGASHNILFEKKYIDLFSLPYDQEIKLFGADLKSEVKAYIARNIKLNLDGKINIEKDIIILEENSLFLEELLGLRIDGIIGGNYFSNLVLEIDYKKNKIHFHNPNTFKASKGFNTKKISIRQSKPFIKTDVKLDPKSDSIPLLFLLDTGAAIPFMVHINSDSTLRFPDKLITGNIGKGLGGTLTGFVGKSNHLNFVSHSFKDIVTVFQDIDPDVLNNPIWKKNGLIGNDLLSRFHLIIDYMRMELHVKAYKNFDKKFEYDKSGLVIFSFGKELDKFYIKQVINGSSADLAGLLPGDIILSINRKPSVFWNISAISKLLSKKEGRKIRMRIMRDDKKYNYKFQLKDYLK